MTVARRAGVTLLMLAVAMTLTWVVTRAGLSDGVEMLSMVVIWAAFGRFAPM